MAIPDFMQEWVDAIRLSIQSTDGMAAQMIYSNAEGNLTNIRGYVRNPTDIDELGSEVLQSALNFAVKYEQNWKRGDRDAAEVRDARRAALDAIDALDERLKTVELSGRASALGY
ncbi:actin-related protein 2/3 complex subunit 2 [Methylobacterium sp. J-043]|nr:actin-related protein 2/3 complex subunit 2 [Methylobacterium sp. J-043]